jgi:hypothetical protein
MLGYVNVVIGTGLLVAGRKLFWLVVGALGFMLGLELAQRIAFRSELVLVLAALALGAVFALLAVFVETVAIGIAGFLGGGFFVMRIASLLGIDAPVARTVAFVFGAILGVAFVIWLFNFALIVISSAAGASMVSSGLFLTDVQRALVFFALLIVGVFVQLLTLRRERLHEAKGPPPPG